MRTTVGPLPSAVYWRRRAVVLGTALVAVLILFLSCSGRDDDAKQNGGGAGNGAATPAPSGKSPETVPSFEDVPPGGGGPALPPPSDATTDPNAADPNAANPNGANPNATNPGTGGPDVNIAGPGGGNYCTDAEMSVTPVPATTSAKRGSPIELKLKIKNISARTCARDVGADLQEIYIKQGAAVVWSSDKCGLAKGSNTKTMYANLELEYSVTWNGRVSSKCSSGLAVGPVPEAGEYQIYARLSAKVSPQVRLVLTA